MGFLLSSFGFCINFKKRIRKILKISTTAPQNNEWELNELFSQIDTIEKNKEKILNTPELYNIHISGMNIAGLYIGNHPLFLGDLLKLWEKEPWKKDDRYYFKVTGSPLSGMSFASYWSKKKGIRTEKNNPSFGTLAFPALRMLQKIKNEPHKISSSKRLPSGLKISDLSDHIRE